MTYKRYFSIIPLLVVLLMTACEDIIEVQPDDLVTRDNFYKDDKDAYSIKAGLYFGLQELVEERFVYGELRADMVVPGPGAMRNRDLMEFFDHKVSADNKYCNYQKFYRLINQCNEALVNLPLIAEHDTEMEEEIFKHLIGEVLWIRAWSYFTLIRNFGDVPFVTEPITEANDVKALSVTSEDDILDQLEADLLWARDYVNINWGWGVNINYYWNHESVNFGAVIGLLTDIYLYRDKYEEVLAEKVAPEILYSHPEYFENWNNSYNVRGRSLDGGVEWFNVTFRYADENYRSSWEEQMFILSFGDQYHQNHCMQRFTDNLSSHGGKYLVKPSPSALKKWTVNEDVNRGAGRSYYIDEENNGDTLIWKYIGLDENGFRREPYESDGNIHILRTAHFYLKAAEALNRMGKIGEAIDIINQVRSRIDIEPLYLDNTSSMEEVEDAIIEELAMELAFESERWYDLMRIARRRNDPSYLADKVLENVPANKKEELRARLIDPSNWILPLGNAAKDLNPNL